MSSALWLYHSLGQPAPSSACPPLEPLNNAEAQRNQYTPIILEQFLPLLYFFILEAA